MVFVRSVSKKGWILMARCVVKSTKAKIEELLSNFKVDDSNHFQRAFEMIALAESVIDEFKGQDLRVNGLFKALQPYHDSFSSVDDKIFVHHCRELVKRFLKGNSLEPGTSAEVMLTLSNTSLIAPLNSDASIAYARIFDSIFGTKNEKLWGSESYKGAIAELIEESKMKLKRKERRV
jgi:hypothetical protein